MRFSPKPLVKAIGRFIRRNDTRILKIVSYGAIAAGTALSVRAGMKAKQEIIDKETELKIESGDPEATLPKKEKAKIIAKNLVPAGMVMAGGVAANEFCFGIVSKKLAVATAVGEFVSLSPALDNSENQSKNTEDDKKKLIIPKEMNGLSDVEFTVYEPLTGQTIKRCTIQKLAVAEMFLNQYYQIQTYFPLDLVVINLGGHQVYPPNANKYFWEQDLIDFERNPPQWIHIIPTLDTDGKVIIRFSTPPKCIDNRMLDKFVS